MKRTCELCELDQIRTMQMAKNLMPNPGEIPSVNGMDIYGEEIQLNGIGGDHIIWVAFDSKKRIDLENRILDAEQREALILEFANKLKDPNQVREYLELMKKSGNLGIVESLKEYRHRGGMLISDATGHDLAAAKLTRGFHEAFLVGVNHELYRKGKITSYLFESLNMRICSSTDMANSITVLYGEIINDGRFRYISAGHPTPVIFSNENNRIMDIPADRTRTSFAIGMVPSEDHLDKDIQSGPIPEKRGTYGLKKRYSINELKLMNKGDILLLYTDGLSDLRLKGTENTEGEMQDYFPGRLEEKLREVKHLSAKEIFGEIKKDIFEVSAPEDDIAYIVVKWV